MRKLLLLTLMLFATLYAKSQTILGTTKSCPNSVFAYGLQNHDNSKQYKWKITKGKRSTDNATEFCGMSASIRWDSDLAQNGKIEIYLVTDCNPGTTGPLVASLNVRSFNFIAGSTMPTTNGTCAATPAYPKLTCGTPQTIDVWFMLPLYGNTDYNDISSYDFIANTNHVLLPTGWSVIAGSLATSDYTCTELANLKYKRIMARVRTDGIHDGEVKVRVSGNCNGTTVPFYGAWSSARKFSFAAPSATIIGPYEFCQTTQSYAVDNLPVGTTITWNATGSIAISGANNVNPVTVSKITNGAGTLSATLTTACGATGSDSKNVIAGYERYISGPASLCLNTWGNVYSVSELLEATDYQWRIERINGTSPVHTMMGNGSNHIYLSVGSAGSFILYLTITTPCGPLETNFFIDVADPCNGGGLFTVYPNPSSSQLRIAYKTDESVISRSEKLAVKNDFIVKLINEKGKVLKQGNTNSDRKEIVLQVADLPNGIYYLHIYEGKKVTKQQVVIAH